MRTISYDTSPFKVWRILPIIESIVKTVLYIKYNKGMKGKINKMANIKMARIDDHFIHGQYAARWCEASKSNLIIVINDELAANKVRQGLLDMAVPSTINSRYYTVEKALKQLPKLSADKLVLLILESLTDLKALMDAGIQFPHVNLGNTLVEPKTRYITKYVSLSDSDFEILNELSSQGVTIDIRRLPEDTPEPFASLLN